MHCMDILYEYTTTLAHYAHLVLAPAGGWELLRLCWGLINTYTHPFIPIRTCNNTQQIMLLLNIVLQINELYGYIV